MPVPTDPVSIKVIMSTGTVYEGTCSLANRAELSSAVGGTEGSVILLFTDSTSGLVRTVTLAKKFIVSVE